MKAALVIYGSLETVSGGYLYDRMLVSKMRLRGDDVQEISQRRRGYVVDMLDNLHGAYPGVDVVLQDELNHPSLFLANRRARSAPIVSIVHHLRSSEQRAAWLNSAYAAVERSYLEAVDGFIFNSETTRAAVRGLLGFEKPHVVATPGGDRLGTCSPDDIERRASSGGTLRLVYVGNVIPGKGLDVLLHAMRDLRAEDLHLDVVGPEQASPAFAAHMRRMAETLGLPVRFRGAIEDAELQTCMQSAHVLVLPSYYEGFGIVILEGMAQGLPVIGAAAGAMPSLIQDRTNGFLTTPGDSMQLAARLRSLARDRKMLLQMSLEARRSFGKFPTWDQSTDAMREFLVSMIRVP